MAENLITVGPYSQFDERAQAIQFALFGPVSCAEFHETRNGLLSVLRRFGSVGPMGEFSTEGDCEYLEHDDPMVGAQARDPDFFVVSDQDNARNRWHRVEADPHKLKLGLFVQIASYLRTTNDWRVYLALGKGGLLISVESICCEGEFVACSNIADIEILCAPLQ